MVTWRELVAEAAARFVADGVPEPEASARWIGLEATGTDASDWADSALAAVSYEGGIYGVPMDFHANLWHVNMDIMAEAGLVENGAPVLPSSPEELLVLLEDHRLLLLRCSIHQ